MLYSGLNGRSAKAMGNCSLVGLVGIVVIILNNGDVQTQLSGLHKCL